MKLKTIHYIVLLIVVICVFFGRYVFGKTNEQIIEQITGDDITAGGFFDIQYQVKGLESIPENDANKSAILSSIQKAIDKVKRIITKSNKLNYNVSDSNIPIKTINDLYVTITISDENIKEESGADSKDTVGGSNIVETQKVNDHIFPVIGTIQMLKTTAFEDVKINYDVAQYPYTAGLNRFYYVFLHELLHVLGVGFLWTEPDYVEGSDKASYNRFWITDATTNPAYVGPSLTKYNGLSATVFYYAKQMGLSGKIKKVPIENNGEPGTKLWHWEQGLYRDPDNNVISEDNRVIDNVKTPGLDNEIMVGWGTDKPPYISAITIANLEDLGYQVNYNEADLLNNNTTNQISNRTNQTSNQTSTNQTTSNQTTSNQTTSDQTTSNQTTSNQTTSNQTTSNQTTNEQQNDEQQDKQQNDEQRNNRSYLKYILIGGVVFLLIIIVLVIVIFFM